MPSIMIGRDDQIEAFGVLLARLSAGRTEQSMIVTGLRGVGKTVLLNRFAAQAEYAGWQTVEIEVPARTDDTGFRRQIAIGARRALLAMSRPERWKARAKSAFSVLTSFTAKADPSGSFSIEFGIEPAIGRGDSGDLNVDLTDLMVSLGEAAREHGCGVAFIVDEIQFLSREQLEALIMAIHKTVQRSLPVTVVGAGLPLIARLSGNAKSYSERLFKFPVIDHLSQTDSRKALREPAKMEQVGFDDDALDLCYRLTDGYPYFLQEIGSAAWQIAQGTRITAEDIKLAEPDYIAKLDSSFFRVRLDRSTVMERAYMRAMAELGAEPQSAKDVASVLDRTAVQLGSTRARLIDKGLICIADGHGTARFTVPHFDKYMRRAIPELIIPPLRSKK